MADLLGWITLAVLTFFAAAAALAIALRSEPSGRAELGIVASAAFFGLIATPVLVLGYTNLLTATRLAIVACVWFLGVFALASRGRPPTKWLREIGHAAASLMTLPLEALEEAVRARSVVTIGMMWTAGVLTLAFVLTVFVPNATWDGFLYHEPIMGFAIQNHGFKVVDLQMGQAVQATNGYPRLCESMSIWLVIFTDKTLIELPNELAAPAMMLVAYALARRFGDRLTAAAWACVLMLMPQSWAELCQTYIDIEVAFFTLVAIYFATRPQFRVRDALLATLGMLLALGSKSSALTTVPPLALIAYARLAVHHGRSRKLATLSTIACGSALLAAVASIVPLRNWSAFRNPLWPVSFESAVLGVHWHGLITLRELTSSVSLADELKIVYGVPMMGLGDVIARGYGYALAWVVGPLALVGVVLGAIASIRAAQLRLLLLATVACVFTAPSLGGHNARYDIHIVACLLAVVTWLLSRARWKTVRVQALASAMVLSMVPFSWMGGFGWYWVSTKHPEDVLRHPLESRVALARPEFDAIAQAREREIGAGDVVVFDEKVDFIGALWNFHFSNTVEYVPFVSRKSFAAELARRKPKWVAIGDSDEAKSVLESEAWEYVGPIAPTTYPVYRRRRP